MEIENYLSGLANKIRKSIPVDNIQVNEEQGIITMWIGNLFVSLDLNYDSVGLISASIQITYYYYSKFLARLYFSPDEVILEDNDRKLVAEFKYIEQDPTVLADEQELVEYLNEIAKINDYEEFKQFAESEFKSWAGLS